METIDPEESQQERIQRLLNEARKRELQEKYGMQFHEGDEPLPPEVEAESLDHIEEFERKFAVAERTTVRQFIGNPSVKPLVELSLQDVEDELDKLLDAMVANNVHLDFLCHVPNEEKYRFIIEELLDEEMDDIRIEGMNHRFIYEEFHPNDEYDAKQASEGLLRSLFNRDPEFIMAGFSKEELYAANGLSISHTEMQKLLGRFLVAYVAFENWDVAAVSCALDGDSATVELDTSWEGLHAADMKVVSVSGRSTVRLKRNRYAGWDVIQFRLAGWEDSQPPGDQS